MDRPEEPDSYDVAEFDKTDPEEGIRNKLKQFMAAVGEKEPLPDHTSDNVGSTEIGGRALIALMLEDIYDLTDAGDLDGALGLVNDAGASGRLTPDEILLGKRMVYSIANEPEKELEVISQMDKSMLLPGTEAELLYRLGRRDELAAWCNAWRDSDGSRTDLYLNRARLMYLDGDMAGALKHADAICLLDDFLLNGRMLAGDILADMGNLPEAVKRYNDALHIDFRNMRIHARKAETLVKMGRPDAAALACRRGLEVRPRNRRLKEILAGTQHE